MLIAMVSLLIALGLRKLGVNIPYFDNVLYATKMKLKEIKFNKMRSTINNTVKTVPIKKESSCTIEKPHKKVAKSVISKPYSGNLKI